MKIIKHLTRHVVCLLATIHQTCDQKNWRIFFQFRYFLDPCTDFCQIQAIIFSSSPSSQLHDRLAAPSSFVLAYSGERDLCKKGKCIAKAYNWYHVVPHENVDQSVFPPQQKVLSIRHHLSEPRALTTKNTADWTINLVLHSLIHLIISHSIACKWKLDGPHPILAMAIGIVDMMTNLLFKYPSLLLDIKPGLSRGLWKWRRTFFSSNHFLLAILAAPHSPIATNPLKMLTNQFFLHNKKFSEHLSPPQSLHTWTVLQCTFSCSSSIFGLLLDITSTLFPFHGTQGPDNQATWRSPPH